MNISDGILAVRTARATAEAETRNETLDASLPPSFDDLKGVFVTISEFPSGDLRGCIGYPEPLFPLKEVLLRSAEAACHDPRFPALTFEETKSCTFEVTILTVPETISFDSPESLLDQIVIGRDGLILEFGGARGLLLPQVPVEWGWNKKEYLTYLSLKAGLSEDTWLSPGVKISRFEGEIFSETSPGGEIVKKE